MLPPFFSALHALAIEDYGTGGRPLDGGHPRADHGGTEQGDSALYRQCARRPRSSSPSHVSNQTGISTIARLVHPPPIAAADSIGYVQPGGHRAHAPPPDR